MSSVLLLGYVIVGLIPSSQYDLMYLCSPMGKSVGENRPADVFELPPKSLAFVESIMAIERAFVEPKVFSQLLSCVTIYFLGFGRR